MDQKQGEIRIDRQKLHPLVVVLWQYAGSSQQEAQRIADHLVAANLAGHDSHGVGMLPSYMTSKAQGHLQANQHLNIRKDAGAMLSVDGNRGFGQVMAAKAMELAIARTRELGMCAIALRNSHHIGRIGHWAEQCARAGFISFHFVNVVATRWKRRLTAAIAASAPTRFALSSRARGDPRCCWILPPAASPTAKPA